jgi:hypothetical protein
LRLMTIIEAVCHGEGVALLENRVGMHPA